MHTFNVLCMDTSVCAICVCLPIYIHTHRYCTKRLMQITCECYLNLHRNLQKEIQLSNMEYISGHRCERTNIVAKCKIIVNHLSVNRH